VANDGWREGVHVRRMRTLPEVTSAHEDFAEFFSREYSRLARACLLLTGNTAEAEDLTQDALARVYVRWGDVGSMDSPEGYLFRTALNLNRKRLRRLAVRARHLRDPIARRDELDVAEERLDVLRAVAALPRAQREAVVLVEWLDLDVDEVAELLGIAQASVRGRLHRARRTLRERFGGSDA
jgi:RNA polymerase sigma-70 factor (ECF subfamily)